MKHESQQRRIVIAMATATIFSACFIWLCYQFFPFQLPPLNSIAQRLAFTLHCDVFAGLMLLIGIGRVAGQRFFSPEAIDGSDVGKSLTINLHYIQNTLEQTVLLVLAHLSLATVIPAHAMKIMPILVLLFVIARLCFWIGYHHNPISRAFGFAATFYPTAAVLVFVVIKIIM